MNFNENLHFLMESRDIQAKELAARTGISINTVKSYLKADAVEPKVSNAVLIARALHVSVESLVSPEGEAEERHPEIHEILRIVQGFTPRELRLALALLRAVQASGES